MRVGVAVVVVVAVAVVVGMDDQATPATPSCPPHNDPAQRPQPCVWATTVEARKGFLDWLIEGCLAGNKGCRGGGEAERHVEYEGYDGWYNNFARPSLGAVDTPLLRLLAPAYSDGVYKPVNRSANPLNVSQTLMSGNNGLLSKSGRTAFQVFFGQQVVEEILDAQRAGCPPEYFNIPIEPDHEYRLSNPGVTMLPLLRTRHDMTTGFSPNNPRQQLNEITPYLDGGLVYGTAKGWADVLRTDHNNKLAPNGQLAGHHVLGQEFPAQNTQRLPMANPPPPTNHSTYKARDFTANVNRFFKLGNPRGNENPFLLTFGIVWYRWHNVLARKIHDTHNGWSSERIFNEARKWVIATYQAIVVYDWLPKYLRQPLPTYGGYKGTIDPQVSHIFQSAAMRFGHTLVTSGVHLRRRSGDTCQTVPYTLVPGSTHSGGVRTCNSFFRATELFTNDQNNFEQFLMGLSSQSTEKEDHIIVDDLRGRVFGPLEFSRRDLMAINLQRGRDHGLPDYNTARRHFGLEPLESLTPEEFRTKTNTMVDDAVLERLGQVYRSVDEVDIWAGGLLETTMGPGQLFSRVIMDQFERVRDGDRFWFENTNNNLFTEDERSRVRQIKIIDVLLSITTLLPNVDIQEDPFTAVHDNNPVSPICNIQLSRTTSCVLPNQTAETLCRYLEQVNDTNTEQCTIPETYDHFTGSRVSYILTFLIILSTCVGLLVTVLMKAKLKIRQETKKKFSSIMVKGNTHKAKEQVAFRESRYVLVVLDASDRRIQVRSTSDQLLRTLDLRSIKDLSVRHVEDYSSLILTIAHHYHLFLRFEDGFHGSRLYQELEKLCTDLQLTFTPRLENAASIRRGVTTVYEREKKLELFSRMVLQNAFSDPKKAKAVSNLISLGKGTTNEFLSMEITQAELASQLGMLPDSIFVQQLFRLMDTDGSGFITIKEFWDVMVVFAQGTPEEKAQLIFNIYDLSHQGHISASDLMSIVKSTLGAEGKNRDLTQVVNTMLESVGLSKDQTIDYFQFSKIFELQGDIFKNVNIDLQNESNKRANSRFSLYGSIPVGGFAANAARKEYEEARQEVKESEVKEQEKVSSVGFINTLRQQYYTLVNKIRGEIQYWFWITLYFFVMVLIFVERAYYYSVEREHGGLRQIAGYGVTVTRGAASAMMFTYSTLLVTMCRNLFAVLRSTALHRLFPFDYMINFHRFIGFWALVWTVMHVIGHAINFYHISTQTPSDLTCLFRDFYRSTHILPKFHYWCWATITGLAGVILTLHTAIIYVFAYFGRRHFFPLFWLTHNTYPIFYGLMILHGSGRLVQPPFFQFFFLGPCILFVLDKLVSISRNTILIDVISAKQLPSSVTRLEIRRPPNFSFQSGQWVKIASTAIGKQEYHPFTLSSSPNEENLTLHIRAVGPWTMKLAEIYTDKPKGAKYPEIYMDGPFGEGHQTWWDYEVVVLVAGGIGVTPFSSILKDIAYQLHNSRKLLRTKKVLFLWTTRSQKQYEWLTDILREVETTDKKNIIRTHIFITQFKSKYDLRTIMLYMAERHFQRVSGTSLFTGLRAVTHFSRPDFTSIFTSIKNKYKSTSIIGVFTCGNPSLSDSVEHGCQEMNKDDGPVFRHYYENF